MSDWNSEEKNQDFDSRKGRNLWFLKIYQFWKNWILHATQNWQNFKFHKEIALRFNMSFFQKFANFGKIGFCMQPEIVQMCRCSEIRMQIAIFTSNLDSRPELDLEWRIQTLEKFEISEKNQFLTEILEKTKNPQNRKIQKIKQKAKFRKMQVPESASHPSVLIWAVGMCTVA